eukprot:4768071-Pyramimonas_sp.AAC.1
MSDLVAALQHRQLVANWDKTGYMTISVDLDQDLNQRWNLSSEQSLSSGRVPGADANSGAARSATEQDKRMTKSASVSARVFALRKAGASVGAIARGSPTVAAVWGAAVAGIADLKLAALRLATVRGEGWIPPGTSVALRLRVVPTGATRDPWAVVVCDVIKHWALNVQCVLPGLGPLQACLQEAHCLLEKQRPWSQVGDPSQAAVLSLARVGCALPSADVLWHPRLGEFNIADFSPAFFVDLVRPLALQASDIVALERLQARWVSPFNWPPRGRSEPGRLIPVASSSVAFQR